MEQELKKVGRPAVGITKKVSITLPAEVWDYIESLDEYSKSAYFREIATVDYLQNQP